LSELVTLAEAVASVARRVPEAETSRHALPAVVSELHHQVRTTASAPPLPVPRTAEPLPEKPQQELEEARTAGYQAGWEAAIRSEVEPQRARIQEEQAALLALTGSIQERLQRLSTELERDAFRFALAVAGRIVRAAVEEDREIVIREIREGVRRVVGVDSIILRINPADEPYVREHRETILTSADSVRQLVIEPDQAIERGGCIIETASGTIDARIATQLKQIEAALFGSQASTGTP